MKPKFWFILAAITAVCALIIGLVMIFSTGTGPRGFVANTYQRAAHLDLGDDGRAYTSSKSPSLVSQEIVTHWRPVAQFADASGIYLRYSDDAVVIQPQQRGSVIRVMDDRDAYRRYHSHVGGFWAWGSPHGETFRGRGPGEGK